MLDPAQEAFGCRPINIGTGNGSTVLEMVAAMEKACGHKIPVEMAGRREGDTEAVWAATGLAERMLGWKARFSVEDMARDQWNWARRFPRGYEQPVEMMRPYTLPRDLSFDVYKGDTANEAAAAVTATEQASAEPAQPESPVIAAQHPAPVATGEEHDLPVKCEKPTGIFREVHEVNANGVDGVPLSGRNGIRGVGGTISKVNNGGKAGVVAPTRSPASKAACALAHG